MNAPELSVVIVNYKTPKLTDTCVGSIIQFTKGISFEIIVVDNQSGDESEILITTKYPQVRWVNMGDNAGTSRAYNRGVRESLGQYILILNSDTELVDDAFSISLAKYKELEKEMKVGLFACQLKGYDNVVQFNCNLEFPLIRKYWRANPLYIALYGQKGKRSPEEKRQQHSASHPCEWIGIAFGLINGRIFREENIWFEEDLFMYADDIEWCYRLRKRGYQQYFSPVATILHLNTGSSTSNAWRNGQVLISEWLYFVKIKGKAYYIASIMLLLFNHMLDAMFYFKQRVMNRISEADRESRAWRRFVNDAIRRYFFTIFFKYKRKTSSSADYLKYVPK